MAVSRTSSRAWLSAIRAPLIELHRVLLESERRNHEADHGRVAPAELLQLALQHERFAWLHAISAVIVRVDQMIASGEEPAPGEVDVITNHLRTLLRPSPDGSPFERRYDQAIQADPSVLLAHRAVMQALPPPVSPPAPTVH